MACYYLTAAMIFLRLARSWEVKPAGRITAFHPSTYSAEYLWPCPSGTPVANGRSAVTCQKVTKGIQNMPLSTSLPGGSLIQSGSLKMRCGLHQTIGSLKSRNSVLKLGGPANSVPAVRLLRSYSPLKAASPPNEPRLSPATNSRGRWP